MQYDASSATSACPTASLPARRYFSALHLLILISVLQQLYELGDERSRPHWVFHIKRSFSTCPYSPPPPQPHKTPVIFLNSTVWHGGSNRNHTKNSKCQGSKGGTQKNPPRWAICTGFPQGNHSGGPHSLTAGVRRGGGVMLILCDSLSSDGFLEDKTHCAPL